MQFHSHFHFHFLTLLFALYHISALAVSNLPKSPAGLPSASKIIARAQLSAQSGSCCAVLSYFLASKVSYPLGAAYQNSLASYWSLQEVTLKPKCVVEPKSTTDVSTAVFLLSLLSHATNFSSECQFAVRGAGHTPWPGAANIQGGVTIDLAGLNAVDVSPNRRVTGIGGGNRWIDVYTKLDALGLSVPGGRVAGVGVGGLTTGGFVCDNVVNYEVVLAYGKVVNANATSHPDLYRSLKGGSSNFGVVTRFDLKTFSQGLIWGGLIVYDVSTREQHFKAFEKLNGASEYDVYAALINNFIYANGSWTILNNYEYTKQPAQPYPTVLKPFTSIQPELSNTMRVASLANLTGELEGGPAPAIRYVTLTVGNSASLMSTIFDLANSTLQHVLSVPGISSIVDYQPIPTAITSRANLTGGNSLGLDPADGPLVNVLFSFAQADAADDARIKAASIEWVRRVTHAAQAIGKFNPYLYLNYAEKWQDPITSYGAANVARLRRTSRKYDPDRIFQKAVPGGFKLFPST